VIAWVAINVATSLSLLPLDHDVKSFWPAARPHRHIKEHPLIFHQRRSAIAGVDINILSTMPLDEATPLMNLITPNSLRGLRFISLSLHRRL
jgi:hypothetical protein